MSTYWHREIDNNKVIQIKKMFKKKEEEDEKINLCIKEKAALFCLSLMLAFVVMFFMVKHTNTAWGKQNLYCTSKMGHNDKCHFSNVFFIHINKYSYYCCICVT